MPLGHSDAAPPRSLLDRHRQLAPTASIKVSPLCLGTMGFGMWNEGVMRQCTKDTTFEILDCLAGNGGNFIDTANVYHNGKPISRSIIFLSWWIWELRSSTSEHTPVPS
jgi:aryl-alcohol dehydrogenase-like predicted oxidoreductase